MTARRSALGRGLDALIPPAAPATTQDPFADAAGTPGPASEAESASDGPTEIRVDRIVPNPRQPRRRFDPTEIEALAASIRRHGLLQPVVVREIPDSAPTRYELVVGERRWRAAERAGLERIPAMLKDVTPQSLLELALVENIQRRDLNPIELALAFQALAEAGATQDEVGRRVGLDRSTVANHLRLLELPPALQEDVESGSLGIGHAKALLQLPDPVRRAELRDRIVKEALSVRAAEDLARRLAGPRPSRRRRAGIAGGPTDPDLAQLVDSLRDHLKTRVRITGSAARGKIEVEFYGPEELHRITRAMLEGERAY